VEFATAISIPPTMIGKELNILVALDTSSVGQSRPSEEKSANLRLEIKSESDVSLTPACNAITA